MFALAAQSLVARGARLSGSCSQHAHRGAQLVVLVAAAACTPAPRAISAPASATVAAIGETLTIESKILGERRVINVYVPPDYATSQERLAVLYMPD